MTAPKLLKSEGAQVLRADDGEIGLATDDHFTKHFFLFGKAPASTKFSLKFNNVRFVSEYYNFIYYTNCYV